ncbi:MAG: hypothetical protein ABW092_21310 [Candidatus Thiodiazotropha sp.]
MPPLKLLFVASLYFASALQAQPQLSRIDTNQQGGATFLGSGFGQACDRCEVIVDYSQGLRYAIPITDWSDRRITARLPDLNRATRLKAVVTTPDGSTAAKPFRLPRLVSPAKELKKSVKPGQHRELLHFEKSHRDRLGGKGEDQFRVSVEPPRCEQQAQVFERARLVYGDKRFAEAQITALPSPGCTRCQPLKVGWYHEPTGRLTYQVHVYRRLIEGICRERIRH